MEPRYMVMGWHTEMEKQAGLLPVVVSTHNSLYDAVKCAVKYVEGADWYHCFVVKVVK